MTDRARSSDRGAVTMLMLAVLVFGLLLTLGVSRVGVAIIGRARADTAADAAALGRGRLARARSWARRGRRSRTRHRGEQRRAAGLVLVRRHLG